jgi:hypothetical protein
MGLGHTLTSDRLIEALIKSAEDSKLSLMADD